MVVIYFPCASVSVRQCELQSLHFPSEPFFLAISPLIFFFFLQLLFSPNPFCTFLYILLPRSAFYHEHMIPNKRANESTISY